MKLGAYDYLLKPFDVPRLKTTVANTLKAALDMRQALSNRAQSENGESELGIVGRTESMQKVFKLIGQLAASDVTVLITGESGTGKEMVARAVYEHGRRSQQPFLAVNCAAIPETLLESELLDTNEEPSPARPSDGSANSSNAITGPCSWMRSAT